jgi:arylsulfatase A-like enzyme
MSEGALRWRAFVPTRWAWPRLLATPSSYLLVVSLVATIGAKLLVIRGLAAIGFWPLRWVTACAIDTAFFLGLAAVLALGEHVSRRLVVVTTTIALVVAALAFINAGYLAMTGQQITWQILLVGFGRFSDVSDILSGSLLVNPVRIFVVVAFLIGPPILATAVLRKAGQPRGVAAGARDRACATAACALAALIVVLVAPSSTQYALARLHTNGVVHTYLGMIASPDRDGAVTTGFTGYMPRDIVESTDVATLRAGARPNVVLIVLESTRRDETSLPGASSRAKTPNLAALAARGTDVRSARSVLPHTSKSVWSMLCARLPLMQTQIYELSATIDVQCLPHVLSAAGWHTGFFQSSFGTFEDRPRLVNQLGFDEFFAAEQIKGARLGYLASEDKSLVAPFAVWLDRQSGPFMATLLTSSTHHPYALTTDQTDRVQAAGGALQTQRDHYDRNIEAADEVIGALIEELRKRGLVESTIVIVVGDHGEGFGEKGVKQHDVNFYEEGLHVPWVMAGPNVPARTIEAATSLADLTPTVLDVLGVSLSSDALASSFARSVLQDQPVNRVLPFSCFYDRSCRGFVVGRTKVVFVPETGEAFRFNLATDPEEQTPLTLPDELTKTLLQVLALIDTKRMGSGPLRRPEIRRYPGWVCPAEQPCHVSP